LINLAKDPQGANAFNMDIDTAYMLPKLTLQKITNKTLPEKLNAGLSVIDVDLINFDNIEKWLQTFGEYEPNIILHRIEQTLVAMLAVVNEKPCIHLPAEYDVAFSKDVSKSVCKHYVGAIRFGFEVEGINYLLKKKSFLSRWNNFIKSTNQ